MNIRPRDTYNHVTQEQVVAHLKRLGLRVLAFRVPLKGDLVLSCLGTCTNPPYISNRDWVEDHDPARPSSWRLIVKYKENPPSA